VTSESRARAPVALFIFKRPDHVRRTIASLQACTGYGESPIVVFADGPAGPRDVPGVERARAVARSLLGDRATFVERDANLGVDRSIIEGVTHLCDRYGEVVVVEDDLVVTPGFLQFLNRGLRRYEDEPRVMQVSGHMFDVAALRSLDHALLLPLTTSWGWATWRRAWDQFDPAADGWRERLSDERTRRRFDLDGHFAYSAMLAREMRRPIPAWDIRWYYSVFVRAGLGLFPPRTLVVNAGFDGSGTHDRLGLPASQGSPASGADFDLPAEVAESRYTPDVFAAIGAFRPASAPRRAMAVARTALRRVGLR
jgi:hypothetical protein